MFNPKVKLLNQLDREYRDFDTLPHLQEEIAERLEIEKIEAEIEAEDVINLI